MAFKGPSGLQINALSPIHHRFAISHMSPLAKMSKPPDVATASRVVAVVIVVLIFAVIGWTGWFIYDVLNSVTEPGEGLSPRLTVQIESPNLSLLEKIEHRLDDKLHQTITSPASLRHPFLFQPAPVESAPIEEPAPAVEEGTTAEETTTPAAAEAAAVP